MTTIFNGSGYATSRSPRSKGDSSCVARSAEGNGMPPKVVILAGAPISSSLLWDESELSREILPCFIEDRTLNNVTLTPPEASSVRWRSLRPLTGFKPIVQEDKTSFAEEATFFSATDITTTIKIDGFTGQPSFEETEDLSQFYDHSFAVHEDVPSSQVSIPISSGTESLEESFWADNTVESINQTHNDDHQHLQPCLPPMLGHLSDLQDIPNAAYLRSINPQTMTVNLIVTILSICPPRRIKTRRWGREMDIVEMVIADETKSGFGITFWLQPVGQDTKPNPLSPDVLRKSLAGLRPRDIILLRTVALSSFKDQVHGQSLRKDMTKIDLLHRRPIGPTDQSGMFSTNGINAGSSSDPQLAKFRRVRDWIMDFVGPGTYENSEIGRQPVGQTRKRLLPPDTQ